MTSTPPAGPPIPEGYQPGDYVPFKDRDPSNPSAIAGQWADPALQAQLSGQQVEGGPTLTHEDRYRAIYGSDAPTRITFASWGRRVLGYLVDSLFGAVAGIPLFVGYWMLLGEIETTTDQFGNQVVTDAADVSSTTVGVLVVGAVISLVFWVWNILIRQGRTGYSLGKTVVGIRLVSTTSVRPIGAGMSFLRQLAHFVDSMVCYLGWLWPLWDSRNQTLADKIVGSAVIVQPQDQLRD